MVRLVAASVVACESGAKLLHPAIPFKAWDFRRRWCHKVGIGKRRKDISSGTVPVKDVSIVIHALNLGKCQPLKEAVYAHLFHGAKHAGRAKDVGVELDGAHLSEFPHAPSFLSRAL